MSTLVIEGLRVAVDGHEIVTGVDLEIRAAEVHAVMGPAGSGGSTLAHAVAGRPGLEVLGGSVRLDELELLDKPAWERAEAGLFLAMAARPEVPGVARRDVLMSSVRTPSDPSEVADRIRAEAERIGLDASFLDRRPEVAASTGDALRNEAIQLGVLRPVFAIFDEFAVDRDPEGWQVLSRRIEESIAEDDLGVLAIAEDRRWFDPLTPDVVHVLVDGTIRESGGASLAAELEEIGYERWLSPPTSIDGPDDAPA